MYFTINIRISLVLVRALRLSNVMVEVISPSFEGQYYIPILFIRSNKKLHQTCTQNIQMCGCMHACTCVIEICTIQRPKNQEDKRRSRIIDNHIYFNGLMAFYRIIDITMAWNTQDWTTMLHNFEWPLATHWHSSKCKHYLVNLLHTHSGKASLFMHAAQ